MKPAMAPHVAQRFSELRETVESDGGKLTLLAICEETGSALVLIVPAEDDMEPLPVVIDSIESFTDSVLH